MYNKKKKKRQSKKHACVEGISMFEGEQKRNERRRNIEGVEWAESVLNRVFEL